MNEPIKKIYSKIESLIKEAIDKIEEAKELADEHGLSFNLNVDDYLKATYKGQYMHDRWESSDPWCFDNRGEWIEFE